MSEVKAFVEENRDWLTEQANSNTAAAWVANALLAEYPGGQHG